MRQVARGVPIVSSAPSPSPRNSTPNEIVAAANGSEPDSRRFVRLSRATGSHADLAHWLLEQETVGELNPTGLAVAAEHVCQKLSPGVSRLVSPAGFQAILSRALHIVRAEFPLLTGVRAGSAPATCLEGMGEHVHKIDTGEAVRELLAVLGTLLDLLVRFIGEDLTQRLVREVWPELPSRESARPENFNGREASP
jgi:hypothetical protein